MSPPRRKLVRLARRSRSSAGDRWPEALADYLRKECHLAENTVAAYGRDLRRFYQWLDGDD